MPKFRFETGTLHRNQDPSEVLLDEREFETDEKAIEHAQEIGAGCLWTEGNPGRLVWQGAFDAGKYRDYVHFNAQLLGEVRGTIQACNYLISMGRPRLALTLLQATFDEVVDVVKSGDVTPAWVGQNEVAAIRKLLATNTEDEDQEAPVPVGWVAIGQLLLRVNHIVGVESTNPHLSPGLGPCSSRITLSNGKEMLVAGHTGEILEHIAEADDILLKTVGRTHRGDIR